MLNQILSTRYITGAIALGALLSVGCQAPNNSSSGNNPATTTPAQATNTTSAPVEKTVTAIAPTPIETEAPATETATASPITQTPITQAPITQAPIETPVASHRPEAILVADTGQSIAEQPSPTESDNEWFYEDRIGPEYGVIEAMEKRKDGCIVRLNAPEGQTYRLHAKSQVCADAYLAETVQLTYGRIPTPTCGDVTDDCARLAITEIQPVQSNPTADTVPTANAALHPTRAGEAVYTEYRNEKRSILVTSAEPWSGENGTGDFRYRGCDLGSDQCEEATGGKAQCNDQVCSIVWDGPAQHSITEPRVDSEAIANYVFIWNYHHAAINEPIDRQGEAFF